LADVIFLDSSDKSKSLEILKESSEASIMSATTGGLAAEDQVNANEAMEMVYHLSIPPLHVEEENEQSNKVLSRSSEFLASFRVIHARLEILSTSLMETTLFSIDTVREFFLWKQMKGQLCWTHLHKILQMHKMAP
jgi:hypothetical protein